MGTSSWRSDLIALGGTDPDKRQEAATRLANAPSGAFDVVRDMVMQKDFTERDPVEAHAILSALKAINSIRAVGVFYELASRTGLVSAKTRMIAEIASELLNDPSDPPEPDYMEDDEATSLDITAPMPRPKLSDGPFPGLGSAPKEVVEAKTSRISASDMWQADSQNVEPTAEPPIPRTNLRYTEEEAANALAWLRCPPFDPVPVGVKEVFEIGRSNKGDLVLAHPSVSRVHAVIRVSGKKMLLEDRSTYGTWVNGERVMSQALSWGDSITVGPYDVLVERTREDEGEDLSDTRPLRTFASSEAIGGRIERVSLAEVLQQMEFNQKTGTLSVFSDDGVTGTLVVYDGSPMYAEFGDRRDNKAVIAMLNLKKGSFSLLNKIEPGEMTMQGTLTGILLEASRQIDEGE